MEILRFVVALVLICALCFSLVMGISTALHTGRIRYGRAQGARVAKRKSQPKLFWLLIFVFALFALATLCVLVWVARETLFK